MVNIKVILPIVLTAMLLVTGCITGPDQNGPTPAPDPEVGKPAPDFQLKNLEGQFVSLSGFLGQPGLINFWATWCPPCRAEMPYLQQVYEEWSDKGLVMLAIDIQESASTVRQFMESNDLSLPILLDSQADVAQKYNITNIPTTFFIDKDGIIQQKVVGGFPSKAAIEEELRQIVP